MLGSTKVLDVSSHCQSSEIEGGMLVMLSGNISLNRVPEVRSDLIAIAESGHALIVVDMTNLKFIDSSGIATLIELLRNQTSANRRLVLCAMQPQVQSMFQIVRLDTLFTIVDDVAAATSQ